MARILINQEILSGIEPLSTVPSADFRKLLLELESTLSVSLSIEEDVIEHLARSEANLPTTVDRDKLGEALVGVQYLRLAPLNEEELLDEVLKGWREGQYSQNAEAIETLTTNVRALLQSNVLHASVKAMSLLTEHDKLLLSSRVITDIRPVFRDDVKSSKLLASLVTHTLRLSLRTNGRPETIYMALDADDLRELRRAVDRALEKADFLTKEIRAGLGGSFGPLLKNDDEEGNER